MSLLKRLVVALLVAGAQPAHATVQTPAAVPAPKSVLIVFSHERERWLYDALEARLRGEIERVGSGVNIYTEYLDAMRFADDEFRDHTVEYFRAKYADRQVSVIVPVSPLALDFVLDHRAQFFPDTPIVFASVNRSRMEELARQPNFTGVAVSRELTSTLDLALAVQPDTQAVYIPAGTTPIERAWTEDTRRSLQPFEKRVKLEFLVGLSMNDLEERLARLPPRSIVLNAGLMYYDAGGQYFVPEEIVRQICRVSSAPVYSTGEPELGLGIVGGSLYDMAPVGAAAGAIVRRILNGETASRIPIEVLNPNENLFDARQLQRWGIDEHLLPAGSAVRFRPPSLWRDYRPAVIGAVALASLQAALIAALIVEHYRRRQAERQSRADLAVLAQLDRRGAMDQLTGTIAHQLFQPLGAILHNAEAGRKMASRAQLPSGGELAEIFDDIANDERRAAEIIQRMRMLLQKRQLETQQTDLNEIALETAELLAPDARSRGVQVESHVADRACIVMGDRIHLQQVLLNLMLNGFDAVAAMPADRRRIVVRTQASDGMAVVSVADKGPGVSPEVLPRLFDPLFTTKSHGTGIGLSIARTIVAAHGGDIAVENSPTAGVTFRFSIPLAKSH